DPTECSPARNLLASSSSLSLLKRTRKRQQARSRPPAIYKAILLMRESLCSHASSTHVDEFQLTERDVCNLPESEEGFWAAQLVNNATCLRSIHTKRRCI